MINDDGDVDAVVFVVAAVLGQKKWGVDSRPVPVHANRHFIRRRSGGRCAGYEQSADQYKKGHRKDVHLFGGIFLGI